MKWLLLFTTLSLQSAWAEQAEPPLTLLEKSHEYMLCRFGVVGSGFAEMAAGVGLTYLVRPHIVSPVTTWSGVFRVIKTLSKRETKLLVGSRDILIYLLRGVPPYTFAKVTLALAADGAVFILSEGRFSVLGYLFGPSGKPRPPQTGDYWACSSY